MSHEQTVLPLIVIVGPTASGKSALGVSIAERFGGEVVVCDSTQLYKGFDIGTAKPSIAERNGIPHHLIDVLAPEQPVTAGGYRQLAIAVLDDLRSRRRIPVFTVGTGLYLRALLEGIADVPQRSEELRQRLRDTIESHAPGYLHRMLQRLDAEAAGKIAPNDEQKLIRAIEVCVLSKRPLSEVHRSGRTPLPGWRPVKIGLLPPREPLNQRIHARTETMLANGWLEEVRALLGLRLPENAKPFDFIGYRELREVLRGRMNIVEARDLIQQGTRRYAKRQRTWFRRETGVHWLEGFGDDRELQDRAQQWISREALEPGRGPQATSV
jgi:tRNA dimethylallyltransferase